MSQRMYYTFAKKKKLIKNPFFFLFFSTFKLGCQERILLCANKSKNGLVITAVNLVHSNHPDIVVENGNWNVTAYSLIVNTDLPFIQILSELERLFSGNLVKFRCCFCFYIVVFNMSGLHVWQNEGMYLKLTEKIHK